MTMELWDEWEWREAIDAERRETADAQDGYCSQRTVVWLYLGLILTVVGSIVWAVQ